MAWAYHGFVGDMADVIAASLSERAPLTMPLTLNKGNNYWRCCNKIQTKEEKRYQIIAEFRHELFEELKPLQNDKKAYLSKKTALLKKFSDALALNIFFDEIEIKEIIQDLATQN